EVSALVTLGASRALREGWSAGGPHLDEALVAAQATGAPGAEAFARAAIADFSAYFGRFGLAFREASHALEIAERIGHLEWTTYALGMIGRLRAECGDPAGARAIHQRMLETARALGTTLWIVNALEGLGSDLLLEGDEAGARAYLGQALETSAEAFESRMRALIALGDLAL